MSDIQGVEAVLEKPIRDGRTVILGGLYLATKESVEAAARMHLQDQGMSPEAMVDSAFHWEPLPQESPLSHKGWCLVVFSSKEVASLAVYKWRTDDFKIDGRRVKCFKWPCEKVRTSSEKELESLHPYSVQVLEKQKQADSSAAHQAAAAAAQPRECEARLSDTYTHRNEAGELMEPDNVVIRQAVTIPARAEEIQDPPSIVNATPPSIPHPTSPAHPRPSTPPKMPKVTTALRGLQIADPVPVVPADKSYQRWPDGWKNIAPDSTDLDSHYQDFMTDVKEREAYWDALGVPCRRAPSPSQGLHSLLPRQYPNIDACRRPDLPDDKDTEYVTLERLVTDLSKAPVHRFVDGELVGCQIVVVPKREVAAKEEEGFKVWYAPKPAYTKPPDYTDKLRQVEVPSDCPTFDKPAADAGRYLGDGLDYVAKHLTARPNWKPGDLIGKNGSKADVKAKSPSYLDSKDAKAPIEEPRSATSTGHLPVDKRPEGIPLGWGGWDEWTRWQSYGRRVPKELVKKEDWSFEWNAPIHFENEKGEVVFTSNQKFDPAHCGSLLPDENLKTLYERVHRVRDRRKKDDKGPTTWDDLTMPTSDTTDQW